MKELNDSDSDLLVALCNTKDLHNVINWGNLFNTYNLQEKIIIKLADKAGNNWACISRTQRLSEGFIREFAGKVEWYHISCYQKLSEEFIREFANKVNWNCISAYQKLSEDFIIEFANKVDWYWISRNQKLSEDFILEFKNRIHFKCIIPCFYSEKLQNQIENSWRYKRL
jgi:hypothetical protein